MKKSTLILALIVIGLGAAFFWLLAQTTPDKAPQTNVTIDLTDRIEN